MKKTLIYLITLCTALPHQTYTMESITNTRTTKTTPKKSLRRTMSDKTQSISQSLTQSIPQGLKSSKKSKSYEHNLFHKKTYDHRLPSLTEEKQLNDLININPREINKIHAHGETLLLWAARNNKPSLVEKLLTYDDILINQKNNDHQTALHYCAHYKNEEIIKILLCNPQTDASLLNSDNKTAREMIEGNSEQDIELRRIIFARIMLDLTINSHLKEIQNNMFIAQTSVINSPKQEKKVIEDAIATIKQVLTNDQNSQKEDRNLPDSAKLPNYADDEFIKKMILFRINNYNN